MSAPSEPEKYSIDDMMERLKKRPHEDPIEDGELVTRADGSQAIRVRKRKRRSHQPHKEQQRNSRRARMIQVSAALIVVLLALFAAGVAILFANSAPFREKLESNIRASTGSEVELLQFRVNPTSAHAGGLVLHWPQGNLLSELSARGIRAEIFPSSFLGKAMTGEEVTAAEGTLTLRIPEAGQPLSVDPKGGGPQNIRFKHYVIQKLHFLLGDSTAPIARMQNSECALKPGAAGERPHLLLTRGDLTLDGWPNLKLDRSHIEFRGNEIDVIGLRLRHGQDSRGAFELSGTFSPYSVDRISTLNIALESFQMSGIAGPELGKLFTGRIDTDPASKSNILSIAPNGFATASLVVDFKNSVTSDFAIGGFAFLRGLTKVLEEEWYTRPVFESDVQGILRRRNGEAVLENLNLVNKSRLALRGSLSIARDRRLSGNLRVGVAEAIIKASKDPGLEAMFGASEEGFRWVALNVSGSAAAPDDNFAELYEKALKQNPSTSSGTPTPSFEDLTRPR